MKRIIIDIDEKLYKELKQLSDTSGIKISSLYKKVIASGIEVEQYAIDKMIIMRDQIKLSMRNETLDVDKSKQIEKSYNGF